MKRWRMVGFRVDEDQFKRWEKVSAPKGLKAVLLRNAFLHLLVSLEQKKDISGTTGEDGGAEVTDSSGGGTEGSPAGLTRGSTG